MKMAGRVTFMLFKVALQNPIVALKKCKIELNKTWRISFQTVVIFLDYKFLNLSLSTLAKLIFVSLNLQKERTYTVYPERDYISMLFGYNSIVWCYFGNISPL